MKEAVDNGLVNSDSYLIKEKRGIYDSYRESKQYLIEKNVYKKGLKKLFKIKREDVSHLSPEEKIRVFENLVCKFIISECTHEFNILNKVYYSLWCHNIKQDRDFYAKNTIAMMTGLCHDLSFMVSYWLDTLDIPNHMVVYNSPRPDMKHINNIYYDCTRNQWMFLDLVNIEQINLCLPLNIDPSKINFEKILTFNHFHKQCGDCWSTSYLPAVESHPEVYSTRDKQYVMESSDFWNGKCLAQWKVLSTLEEFWNSNGNVHHSSVSGLTYNQALEIDDMFNYF